ncbi:hypothetical protein DZK27_17075 [Rhodobacteraceae bacterium 63075]|nr:hypothetical protein DZK27_17075 [Rhodobacteraceae bacterium 63075]
MLYGGILIALLQAITGGDWYGAMQAAGLGFVLAIVGLSLQVLSDWFNGIEEVRDENCRVVRRYKKTGERVDD